MIELEEYKKALGDVTDELSEEEITKVWKIQDDLAELFFILWADIVKEKNHINSPLESEIYEGK